MIISIIAAMGKNRVIGKGNTMPWHLPADLKHFKSITMSKPIIMGRKTFESIGKPLPGRQNIIISRNADLKIPGCGVVTSLEAAIDVAGLQKEVMVIGGAQIYKQAFPLANRLYLTLINAEFEGDTFFPEYDLGQWREISREDCVRDDKNPYDYSFAVYENDKY